MFVTMIDSCLSGWGLAKGKLSVCIFSCDTDEEVEIVRENAESRREMHTIKIHEDEPDFCACSHHVARYSRANASRWYKKEAFL